jgi:hypothetical protein
MASRCLIVLCFFYCSVAIAQIDDRFIQSKVLKREEVGRTFIFGEWKEIGETSTHLKYLGSVKTIQGKTFKIVTSARHWGQSHHITSKILIYNSKNQYVGEYNIGSVIDLPLELQNGELVFYNANDSCDTSPQTRVTFRKGLPYKFFIKCRGKYGDFYSFSSI